ncbi:hypothetical protein L798_03555 [Zootermopsis nevadensis]|uniref:Uncharacterized protein n=1 Tax=Zootermopsis nevadensis TaxID=136037 RepID=A0A067RLY2_ZOONE|nr:hypothetical protein L798_03555 [Zootermopsis nevadensis]
MNIMRISAIMGIAALIPASTVHVTTAPRMYSMVTPRDTPTDAKADSIPRSKHPGYNTLLIGRTIGSLGPRYNPQDSQLRTHRRENRKPYKVFRSRDLYSLRGRTIFLDVAHLIDIAIVILFI